MASALLVVRSAQETEELPWLAETPTAGSSPTAFLPRAIERPDPPARTTPVPQAVRTLVSGVLRGPRGEPVAAETVELRSRERHARYKAVSDEAGAFSIPGILVAGGYELTVRPRAPYENYSREDVAVPTGGLTLEVVLSPLPTRRVLGRIVDADGRPIPGFRLWLGGDDTHKRSVEASTDEAGRFGVDGVLLGRLRFTASSSAYVMRGEDRSETAGPVDLLVDAGSGSLEGRTLDPRGDPLPGTRLELVWAHRDGAGWSTSERHTTSDREGRFRFDGLGPGPHRLKAQIPASTTSRSVQVPPGATEIEIVFDDEAAR